MVVLPALGIFAIKIQRTGSFHEFFNHLKGLQKKIQTKNSPSREKCDVFMWQDCLDVVHTKIYLIAKFMKTTFAVC